MSIESKNSYGLLTLIAQQEPVLAVIPVLHLYSMHAMEREAGGNIAGTRAIWVAAAFVVAGLMEW